MILTIVDIMINRLDYKNDLLNEKVNFFWDYYDYFITMTGQVWYFELENPWSLVQKIIFQLDSNIFLAHNYLPLYFEKLLKYEKKYLNIFPDYRRIHLLLEEFKNITPQNPKKLPEYRKQWLIRNQSQLLTDFEDFNKDLRQRMLDNSVNGLISILKCLHPLIDHKEDIIFHTKIIGSECLLNKKERKEALRMFSYIVSRDYRKFCYPKGIITLEQQKQYFEQKDFNKTYQSIIDFIYVPTEVKYIICKVETLLLGKKHVFEFGGVTFYPKNHPKLKKVIEFVKRKKSLLVEEIYLKGNYSLAVVEVVPQELALAIKSAKKKVDRALYFLNSTLDANHAVDTKNFLYTSDFTWFGYTLSPRIKPIQLSDDDLYKLNDNAYNFLRDKTFVSKDTFLQHEMEFIFARKSSDIYGLWRYLEVLLFDKTKETNKIKRYISNALLLTEKKYHKRIYSVYIKSALQSTEPDQLGVTTSEYQTFFSPKYSVLYPDNIKGLFIKEAYLKSKQRFTIITKQKIFDYYFSILTEAYEQRNSIAHSGISQDRATTKLQFSLNLIVTRLRWLIFDYMKNYKNATLDEIFSHIKDDAARHFPTRR